MNSMLRATTSARRRADHALRRHQWPGLTCTAIKIRTRGQKTLDQHIRIRIAMGQTHHRCWTLGFHDGSRSDLSPQETQTAWRTTPEHSSMLPWKISSTLSSRKSLGVQSATLTMLLIWELRLWGQFVIAKIIRARPLQRAMHIRFYNDRAKFKGEKELQERVFCEGPPAKKPKIVRHWVPRHWPWNHGLLLLYEFPTCNGCDRGSILPDGFTERIWHTSKHYGVFP